MKVSHTEKPKCSIMLEREQLTTMIAIMTEEQARSTGYTTSYDGVGDLVCNGRVDTEPKMPDGGYARQESATQEGVGAAATGLGCRGAVAELDKNVLWGQKRKKKSVVSNCY